MKTIKELQPLIIDWAKAKNITNPDKQYLKILEEVGETAKEILRGDNDKLKLEIGDIAVSVIIYYWQEDFDIQVEEIDDYICSDKALLDRVLYALSIFEFDVLVDINALTLNYNTTLEECLNLAWCKIENRTGKTVNGTFIKD